METMFCLIMATPPPPPPPPPPLLKHLGHFGRIWP